MVDRSTASCCEEDNPLGIVVKIRGCRCCHYIKELRKRALDSTKAKEDEMTDAKNVSSRLERFGVCPLSRWFLCVSQNQCYYYPDSRFIDLKSELCMYRIRIKIIVCLYY